MARNLGKLHLLLQLKVLAGERVLLLVEAVELDRQIGSLLGVGLSHGVGPIRVILDPAHVRVVPILLVLGCLRVLGRALRISALRILARLRLGHVLLLLRVRLNPGHLLEARLLLRLPPSLAVEVEEQEDRDHHGRGQYIKPFFHRLAYLGSD